jgi:nucleoside-diphosphate-sugar epimerase
VVVSGGLLVTGATGFVGAAVRRHLPAGPVRLLTHRRPAGVVPAGVEVVTGDVTDPGSLRGVCDGVDAVLHLANAVQGDDARCRAVNDEGTAALLAEAGRAGVRRGAPVRPAQHGRRVRRRGVRGHR